MGYIDNWIFAAQSLDKALQLRKKIAEDIEILGWVRHPEKGTWNPRKKVEYLGVIIDTELGRWFVPEGKIIDLESLAKPIIEGREVSVRKVAKVAGKIIAMSRALPIAKLYVRETFQAFIEKGTYKRRNWKE